MKQMKKSILLLLLLPVLLLSGCGFQDDDVSKERIVAYVTENQDKLSAYVRDMPEDAAGQEALFRERFGRRTIVKSVYLYQDGILEFYCGGTGLSTNSTDSGFYWSENDTPFTFEFQAEDRLEETEPGVLYWNSRHGEEIWTERILPGWFWYHIVWY